MEMKKLKVLVLLAVLAFAAVAAQAESKDTETECPCKKTSEEKRLKLLKYPCKSKHGKYGFCNKNMSVKQRAKDLVQRLTLKEKINQLGNRAAAVPRLGIPKYEWWSEALHGVSNVGPGTNFSSGVVKNATSFPQVILTAASFNASLWEAIGEAVSTEARAMHNVGQAGLTFWSPTINLVRDPRWGRTQESPGEDPLVVGTYAASYVRGLQRLDKDTDRLKVAACCKHYTAYDIDNWKGIQRYDFDSIVTKQDLIDTFNSPFQRCVHEGNVASVMCSYNQVNGVPTCADKNLLSGVIRDQWNLNGYIVSDCDSVEVLYKNQNYTMTPEDAVAITLNAGLNLDCGKFVSKYAMKAVKRGKLNESTIDESLVYNFQVLVRLGWFDGNPKDQAYGKLGPKDVCSQKHRELALDAARQGIVLLKNDNATLPLSKSTIKTIAVIGPNANATKTMIGNYAGIPCGFTSPLKGLGTYAKTMYAPGCNNMTCNRVNHHIQMATSLAAKADATILVMGTNLSIEAESLDRTSFLLPGHQGKVVKAVAKASKGPVILVLMSAGPFDISFAKNNNKIGGIIWVGYPGELGGQAIADIIFGTHNPEGRLPVSWYPNEYTKIPMNIIKMRPDPARGYPGRTYRFYTGKTLYDFGYGMSYTIFSHTVMSVNAKGKQVLCQQSHGKMCLAYKIKGSQCLQKDHNNQLEMDLVVEVKNLGKKYGGEAVLLFSKPPAVEGAPRKQLIQFKKVNVKAGGSENVQFSVNICKDLATVDASGNNLLLPGSHIMNVGNSVQSWNITVA